MDRNQAYRVRFTDGFEAPIHHDQLVRLAEFKSLDISENDPPLMSTGLYQRVIYRCVIGSRAYGLEDEASDTDRRGVYLPSAELHWSLFGIPEQLENDQTQEVYWELQKFIVLALKANPNVLECLYSPIVEFSTPLGQELRSMRSGFLSKLIFQTFSGYVASQFKKMQTSIRNQGQVNWKHVMHLTRLLMSGTHILRSGEMMVEVGQHRDRLLTIKRGEMPFATADSWRKELQSEFESAFQTTRLPDRPDYERANAFLVNARGGRNRRATTMTDSRTIDHAKMMQHVESHPYPLLFVTISGAHLYGFPSPDSDFDLRGVHLLPLESCVGLDEGVQTLEKEGIYDGLEIDLVTHDAEKFFRLMLKRNGYVLEQIYSPLVVYSTPEHDELKSIAKNCITRYHAHHYLGFAATQWKLFAKESPPRVKPLLYVYRVLLTGIHLMHVGRNRSQPDHIEPNSTTSVH